MTAANSLSLLGQHKALSTKSDRKSKRGAERWQKSHLNVFFVYNSGVPQPSGSGGCRRRRRRSCWPRSPATSTSWTPSPPTCGRWPSTCTTPTSSPSLWPKPRRGPSWQERPQTNQSVPSSLLFLPFFSPPQSTICRADYAVKKKYNTEHWA